MLDSVYWLFVGLSIGLTQVNSNLWTELLSGMASVELETSDYLLNRLKKAKRRFHSSNLIKNIFGSLALIQYFFNRNALFALTTLPIYPSTMVIEKKQNSIIVCLSIGDAVKNGDIIYK
jgi:hypothetical protein